MKIFARGWPRRRNHCKHGVLPVTILFTDHHEARKYRKNFHLYASQGKYLIHEHCLLTKKSHMFRLSKEIVVIWSPKWLQYFDGKSMTHIG